MQLNLIVEIRNLMLETSSCWLEKKTCWLFYTYNNIYVVLKVHKNYLIDYNLLYFHNPNWTE